MKCDRCGKEIPDTDLYCGRCGKAVFPEYMDEDDRWAYYKTDEELEEILKAEQGEEKAEPTKPVQMTNVPKEEEKIEEPVLKEEIIQTEEEPEQEKPEVEKPTEAEEKEDTSVTEPEETPKLNEEPQEEPQMECQEVEPAVAEEEENVWEEDLFDEEDEEEEEEDEGGKGKKPGVKKSASPQEDIYAGLHPIVAAELQRLQKRADEADEKELMDVAKRYEIIGKKPEELVPVLKSLKNAGGSAYADMINILDASVEAVNKSSMFTEIGKSGGYGGETDAWSKIEKKADEIQAASPTMSRTAAIDMACQQNPQLVHEYENGI